MQYYVYILASKRNGTLYIGSTSDLVKRVWQHKKKVVEGFTKKYGVNKLVHYEIAESQEVAAQRERQLKKWNRAWKIRLIEEKNPEWKDLYEDLIDASASNTMKKPMTSKDVINFYTELKNLGIEIWVDGGWSVDALLGKQQRPHKDLDIAIQWKDVPRLREALAAQGYKQVRKDSQWNFVLADDKGHEVDVHAFVYDDKGNVVDGIMYPAESLTGIGTIGGHKVKVKCISAEYMVKFISPWLHKRRDKDFKDVSAICEKFGIDYPEEYIHLKKSDNNVIKNGPPTSRG